MDRFFTSYFLQDILIKNEIDFVTRSRDDFAKKNLGDKADVVVVVSRRERRSRNNYLYDLGSSSKSLTLRIIKSEYKRKGFRDTVIYIVTSLIKEKRSKIVDIYLKRWNIEVDFRNLKTTLNSSFLKSKKSALVELEIYINLIGYNVIRIMILKHLKRYREGDPRRYSFKGVAELLSSCYLFYKKKIGTILKIIQGCKLQKAKYRYEPRAIKKRNSKYSLLTTSREDSRLEKWSYSRRKGEKNVA